MRALKRIHTVRYFLRFVLTDQICTRFMTGSRQPNLIYIAHVNCYVSVHGHAHTYRIPDPIRSWWLIKRTHTCMQCSSLSTTHSHIDANSLRIVARLTYEPLKSEGREFLFSLVHFTLWRCSHFENTKKTRMAAQIMRQAKNVVPQRKIEYWSFTQICTIHFICIGFVHAHEINEEEKMFRKSQFFSRKRE